MDTILVCSEFFLKLETVTKINGRQFFKKDHILTNENWASGNHFFSIFLDSNQLLPVGAVFNLTKTYWTRGNEVFICFLSIVLFRLLLKLEESQCFKDEPYSCQWTPTFSIFQRLVKVKQLFRIEETYFSIFLTRLVQTDFLLSGNSIIWSVLFRC